MNAIAGHDDSAQLSGTSYAAPVVSGLAALIRARFPKLTARQVMQRIEATAHHPPGGRDSLIGSGVVDMLAAVSTDPPVSGSPPPPRLPVPIAPPPLAAPAGHDARNIALIGATVCGVVLAVVVLASTLTARLRRD
jgi:membrane-anchored mycosin MYCP